VIGLLSSVVVRAATGGLRDYGLDERLTEGSIIAWLAITGLVFVFAPRPRPAEATVNPPGPVIAPSQQA
jgi:hypothetical protein